MQNLGSVKPRRMGQFDADCYTSYLSSRQGPDKRGFNSHSALDKTGSSSRTKTRQDPAGKKLSGVPIIEDDSVIEYFSRRSSVKRYIFVNKIQGCAALYEPDIIRVGERC